MVTTHPDRLVVAYLRRLEGAAAALPSSRRAELVSEIRAHVDDALREAGVADEVTVRNVLERLGSPEEIASAAIGPRVEPGPSRDKFDIAALLMLALGGFLPVVGWVVGVVLVLASSAWSGRDKAVGLVLGLLPALVLLLVLLASPGSGLATPTDPSIVADEAGSSLGAVEWLLLTWGFVSGLPSAAYLAYRLRHGGAVTAGGPVAPAGAASN